MFRYITKTAKTLSPNEELQKVFEDQIPRLGHKHPFVISALLSIAALHCFQDNPANKSDIWIMCKRHQNQALASLQQ
jgi:hypothetical protein